MAEKSTYAEQAENLRRFPCSETVISNFRGVPEVLSAYIFAQCGALLSDEALYYPEVWMSREMNEEVRYRALLLNRQDTWNPTLLRQLIFTASELDKDKRAFLLQICGALEHYRPFAGSRWFEARDKIVAGIPLHKGTMAQLNLHDYLSAIMDANFDDPRIAFRKGVDGLDRLANQPLGLGVLNPIKDGFPVLKNPTNEPVDIVDFAEFEFDRLRAVYLPGINYRIVVGGAPNSGKSTFTASLGAVMRSLIRLCEVEGILGEGEVKTEVYNLDTISPTVHNIVAGGIKSGKEPYRNSAERWDRTKADRVQRHFMDLSQGVNIALGDLPGGRPDDITDILASNADFSILVNRTVGEEAKDWRNFLAGLSSHSNLVRVHTRFQEPNRSSGIREYQSTYRGHRRNLLWGRVVDLDRSLRTEDPFIGFVAHALLFDYLPGKAISNGTLHSQVHNSLRGRYER